MNPKSRSRVNRGGGVAWLLVGSLASLGVGSTGCSGCSHPEEKSEGAVAGANAAVIGSLTSTGNGAARTYFGYDALGRTRRVEHVLDGKRFVHTTTYGYPDARAVGLGSHVTEETYADGERVRYVLDRAGGTKAVSTRAPGAEKDETIIASSRRNARGDVVEEKLGDGTTTVHRYNDESDQRLRSIRTLDKDGKTLQSLVYEFDAWGNVTGIANEVRPELSATFEYDALDRLVRTTAGGQAQAYGYDASGNLTSKEGHEQQYGDPAHAHALTAANGVTYAYDANGNLIRGGSLAVDYDAENMPIRAARDGKTVTRRYIGESMWRKNDAGRTVLYAGDVRYEVEPGKGIDEGVFRKAIAGNLAERETDGRLRFYHSDLIGSSVFVTDGGEVVHDDAYAPYGTPRTNAKRGDFVPKKKFHGNEDDSLGFLDFGARLYMPELGRWMTPDTFMAGNAPLNRYAYASNNPVSRIDPDGHLDQEANKRTTADQAGDVQKAVDLSEKITSAMITDPLKEAAKRAPRTVPSIQPRTGPIRAANGARTAAKALGKASAALGLVGDVATLVQGEAEAVALEKKKKPGHAAIARGAALGDVLGSKAAAGGALCGYGAPACALVLKVAGGKYGRDLGGAVGGLAYSVKENDPYFLMRDNLTVPTQKPSSFVDARQNIWMRSNDPQRPNAYIYTVVGHVSGRTSPDQGRQVRVTQR